MDRMPTNGYRSVTAALSNPMHLGVIHHMNFSQPTDLTKLLSDIQNHEKSHVDMIKRRAKGSQQWFLEKDSKTHPVHDNNDLRFHICGQDAFAAIEKDIRAAVSSIDLVL